MPRFLILLPTHAHGELLARSVASARAQRLTDWELILVGDGPTPETRAAGEAEAARDPRVRYREFPKSGRTGEPSRDVLLRQADADLVAYLADDDLWRCDHLERLAGALADADFASAGMVTIAADGSPTLSAAGERRRDHRELWARGTNFASLGACAHRLATYFTLPHGWEATPPGVPTDVYMWRTWAAAPQVRFASVPHVTYLRFESPGRESWTLAERAAELDRWLPLVTDPSCLDAPAWLEALVCEAARGAQRRRDEANAELRRLRQELRMWRHLGPAGHARRALAGLFSRFLTPAAPRSDAEPRR